MDIQGTFNRGKGVIQLNDGEIIAHFNSIGEAYHATGISQSNIQSTCKGKRPSAGGFQWIYA